MGDCWKVEEVVEETKTPKIYKICDKIRAECCLGVYLEGAKILTH